MLEFISTIILMLALGVIVYLMALALPRVEEKEAPKAKIKLFEHFLHSGIPEKIDRVFNKFLAKFLRKIRILILKIDNLTNSLLKKTKPQEHQPLEHLNMIQNGFSTPTEAEEQKNQASQQQGEDVSNSSSQAY